MLYKELAQLYESLDSTNSRLKKTYILAKFIPKITESNLEPILLLIQGRVYPEWESKKIGVAGKLVAKAIANSMGHSETEVIKQFKKTGDLGQVAYNLCENKKQQTLFSKQLTVKEVFTTLQKLAEHEGIGSQDVKLSNIHKLLGSADKLESKFIVRTILEDLRIGIALGTIRDAIAYAFFANKLNYNEEKNSLEFEMKDNFTIEEQKNLIKRSLDLTADLSKVILHIKEGKPLNEITLQVGTPCKAMLARKERTFEDAFKRTNLPCRVEYKYDGFRVQIHKNKDKVLLFTRSLEDVTKQFPEVISYIKTHVKSEKCILDGELVGFDKKTQKYLPFQNISQRIRRKYEIEKMSGDFPVEANIFDVILNENKILLEIPFQDRLKILQTIVKQEKRKIVLAEGKIISEESQAQKFYEESLKAGNEGIMLKDLQGLYEPGGRVTAWIKFKPVMQELDLVIIGAEWGEGKRSNWLTSFTLACQNEDGEYLEIGKVGTGFKELANEDGVTFEELTKLLEPIIISEKGKEVKTKPEIVIEIQYEEIQKSNSYSSGYALRFPRVTRLRPDRNPEDITFLEDIQDLYYNQ
ncbi:MAG: ATP-dependent DNA ligase [Candidatus Woesearchaeota archaeon]